MRQALRWFLYAMIAVAALAAGAGVVIAVQAFTEQDKDRPAVDVALRTSALVGDVSGLLRELQSPAVASDPQRRRQILAELADREATATDLLADTEDLDQSDPKVKRLAATNRAVKDSAANVRKAAKVGAGATSKAAAKGLQVVASYQDDAEQIAADLRKKKPGLPGTTAARKLEISPVDLPHTPYVLRGGASGEYLGAAVDGAGDFDGDGHDDVIVAAPGAQSASIVYGGDAPDERVLDDLGPDETTTISALPAVGKDFVADDSDPEYDAIYSIGDLTVAGVDDVNGDGLDDVAIGVPEAEVAGDPEAGSVFVVFGSREREDVSADDLGVRGFRVDGPAPYWRVGSAVTVGDLDDDGKADVVVGGREHRGRIDGTAYQGAYVTWAFLRAPAPGQDVHLTRKGMAAGVWRIAGVGASLDAEHDFTGDGRDDIVAGDALNRMGAPGYAAVVAGFDGNGLQTDATERQVGVLPIKASGGRQIGYAVASVDDLDGDGRDEAVLMSNDEHGHRRAHVIFGTAARASFDVRHLGAQGATVDPGAPAGDGLGAASGEAAVAAVGDMDGDGRSELAVSAPLVARASYGDETSYYDGGARIVSGSAFTRGAHIDARASSDAVVPVTAIGVSETSSEYPYGTAGGVLAGVGDLDGDRLVDLAVGAPRAVDARRDAQAELPEGEGALYVTTRKGIGEKNPLAGPVTADGLGRVRVGDSPRAVASTLTSTVRRSPVGDPSGPDYCGYVPTADSRVNVMVNDGSVGRIEISGPGIPTREGVEVGDGEAKVRRVYGPRGAEDTNEYGTDEVSVKLPNDRELLFLLTDAGQVSYIYAGRRTEVEFIEGCI